MAKLGMSRGLTQKLRAARSSLVSLGNRYSNVDGHVKIMACSEGENAYHISKHAVSL